MNYFGPIDTATYAEPAPISFQHWCTLVPASMPIPRRTLSLPGISACLQPANRTPSPGAHPLRTRLVFDRQRRPDQIAAASAPRHTKRTQSQFRTLVRRQRLHGAAKTSASLRLCVERNPSPTNPANSTYPNDPSPIFGHSGSVTVANRPLRQPSAVRPPPGQPKPAPAAPDRAKDPKSQSPFASSRDFGKFL